MKKFNANCRKIFRIIELHVLIFTHFCYCKDEDIGTIEIKIKCFPRFTMISISQVLRYEFKIKVNGMKSIFIFKGI